MDIFLPPLYTAVLAMWYHMYCDIFSQHTTIIVQWAVPSTIRSESIFVGLRWRVLGNHAGILTLHHSSKVEKRGWGTMRDTESPKYRLRANNSYWTHRCRHFGVRASYFYRFLPGMGYPALWHRRLSYSNEGCCDHYQGNCRNITSCTIHHLFEPPSYPQGRFGTSRISDLSHESIKIIVVWRSRGA